jgi:hypothetical protein
MSTYDVYLRSDLRWAERSFKALNAKRAMELARRFAEKRADELLFEDYAACDSPINEIEILDEHERQVALWRDEDLRLHLAARDFLDAAEKVVARWEQGDLADAVRELAAAVAKAKEGAS